MRRALLVPIVAVVGCGGSSASPPERDASPAAARAKPVRHVLTFDEARRRGQPIAILTRPTALLDGRGRRVAKLGLKTEFGAPSVLPALAARDGRLRVIASQLANGRRGWIDADAATIDWTPWSATADLSERTLVVRRDGRVVRRVSVAIGGPRTPTPTGRFAVTDKLRLNGGSGAYGWGVLALSGHQPHVEPGWRGGDRLAVHGTASPSTIGTAASFGCLRASRKDVRWLVRRVWLGSIVTVRR